MRFGHMYGTIYKITNTKTNKIYIGKTVKSIDQRLAEHIAFAESGANTKLARSIRKYGKEAFIIESIDKADSEEDLNQKEIY